ncbi:MAG: hypothetical protein KGI38_02210 [Thaumarchaeota archaeon]|nr:hypothetical protein [Nitrososphaerota archaeon]
MIKVDCSDLSGMTKLGLAEAISDGLGGKGIALLDGKDIAIDTLSGPELGIARIQSMVVSYLSGRKDASAYSVEDKGNLIVVHSSAVVSAQEKKVSSVLPPNLLQCPDCGFLTTSQNQYEDHLRIHDLMRGIAR